MKERFILFSGPMVRALLRDENPKTQTRRPMNPQPDFDTVRKTLGCSSSAAVIDVDGLGGVGLRLDGGMEYVQPNSLSPYGLAGDHLWVKETFVAFGRWETRFDEKKARDAWHFVDMTIEAGFAYRFEGADRDARRRAGDAPTWHTRPSLFMLREASRITLDITGVRIEPLQDISEADASAEGIELLNGRHTFNGGLHQSPVGA
jgi:hypothetical protein